jgi:hypothetical protein
MYDDFRTCNKPAPVCGIFCRIVLKENLQGMHVKNRLIFTFEFSHVFSPVVLYIEGNECNFQTQSLCKDRASSLTGCAVIREGESRLTEPGHNGAGRFHDPIVCANGLKNPPQSMMKNLSSSIPYP